MKSSLIGSKFCDWYLAVFNRRLFEAVLYLGLGITAIGLTACRPRIDNSQALSMAERQSIEDTMVKSVDTAIANLEAEQLDPEYQNAIASLYSQNGLALAQGGRSNFFKDSARGIQQAWQKANRSLCKILAPVYRAGRTPYFFVGTAVDGGKLGIKGVVGIDFVWDMYNMQFSSFKYAGGEFAFGAATSGVGVSYYFGVAFGKKDDVDSAWSGQFSSATVAGNLPILADFVSFGGTAFSSSIGIKPDFQIVGAAATIQLSVSVPTGSAFGGSVQLASWQYDKLLNSRIFENWQKVKLPVANLGSEACNGRCIRFDDSVNIGATFTGRAKTLLKSVPALVDLKETPLFASAFTNVALLGLVGGIVRDAKHGAESCGFANR